jgi:transketolase
MIKLELNVHQNNIIRWAREHTEVIVLSADLGGSCEIKEFSKVFPERYFSLGIAEQNMVSWAAGLCREGFWPYLHSFGVFLYRRVLDQLEMSVAYPNLPVTFVGFLPGIMTPGGVTHQAVNDVAVLRNVPNLTILDTGDATDIESVLDAAHEAGGPVFIRMLRKEVPRLFPARAPMVLNRGRVLSEGTDAAVFSSSICTEEALRAVKLLQEKGLSVQHMHISTLKPFSDPNVLESLRKVKYGAVTFENHTVIGGLGSCVAEVMAENRIGTGLVRVGIQDVYTHGASRMYLMKKYGLNAAALIAGIEQLTGKSFGIEEAALDAVRFEDYSAV